MNSRVTIFYILALVVFSKFVIADIAIADKRELPLNEVLQATFKFHPLIKAAEADIQGMEGELLSSQGQFDRILRGEMSKYGSGVYNGAFQELRIEQPIEWGGANVFAGVRNSNGKFPIYEDYLDERDAEIRLGVELPLLRDRLQDKRRVGVTKAKISKEISKLSYDMRALELIRQASIAYWEWAAAKEKLALYSNLHKVALQRDRQFARRGDLGDLAKFDYIDNKRQLKQRESQLLEAERTLKQKEFSLSLYYRSESGDPKAVFTRSQPEYFRELRMPVDFSPLALAGEIFTKRPDVTVLEKLAEQAQVEVTLAENDRLPRIDLQTSISRDHGSYVRRREDPELKVGLLLEIPLQTREQDGRVISRMSQVRQINSRRAALVDKINADLADSLNALDLAKQRSAVAKEELNIAKELEAGENKKFELGDSNLIFVNLREQTTADAGVRYIDTILDFRSAEAEYLFVAGDIDRFLNNIKGL